VLTSFGIGVKVKIQPGSTSQEPLSLQFKYISMSRSNFEFSEEELKQELGTWRIEPLSNGFAQAYKVIYKTYQTTIAAKAFFIPDQKTNKMHHFDLSLRIFKRRKKSDPWVEQIEEDKNEFGDHRRMDFNVGSGKAVKELTKFLNAQYEHIGEEIKTPKIVIDNPSDYDVEKFISEMSLSQIEDFSNGVRIQSLKEYRDFLKNNLDKNETFIQSWLDEEDGKFRKQRCLIFGLEFIDHKREGELSRKRFDILTRSSMSKNEYVIFELKSPSDEIFKVKESKSKQGGISTEYHLSPQLSRAIPQILRYRSKFENAPQDDDDLQRIGIQKGNIRKCIILLGQRKNDPIWNNHFQDLKSSLSNNLEILTYTDLIDKLDVTIQNLEDNLDLE